MTKVAKDTVARVHYTGTFPDSGEEFDTSRNGDPLTFLVGHKGMIPGFERELMGATNPANADDGTIRKDFGESVEANSVHGSDSLENAAIEIAYFFSETDVVG